MRAPGVQNSPGRRDTAGPLARGQDGRSQTRGSRWTECVPSGLSSAWGDPALPAFSHVRGELLGTGVGPFKRRGLRTLPTTLGSPCGLIKPSKLSGSVLDEFGAILPFPSHSPTHLTTLHNFPWGTSAGWRRGCGSRSGKKEPPSSAKLGHPTPHPAFFPTG